MAKLRKGSYSSTRNKKQRRGGKKGQELEDLFKYERTEGIRGAYSRTNKTWYSDDNVKNSIVANKQGAHENTQLQKQNISKSPFGVPEVVNSKADVAQIIQHFKNNPNQFGAIADRYIRNKIGNNKALLVWYIEGIRRNLGRKALLALTMQSRNQKEKSGCVNSFVTTQNPPPSIKKSVTDLKTQEPNDVQPADDKKELYEATKQISWVLDWECVTFKKGYFRIVPPTDNSVYFKPTNIGAPESIEAFNYLKGYLNKKLPMVFCVIDGQKLTISSHLHLQDAIQTFARAAKQQPVKSQSQKQKIIRPVAMSFTQALSKGAQMTEEDFKKYKSKFIDFLVEKQADDYKVIPCVESIAHANVLDTEYAFMFSLSCELERILIVHENVNPDRSTLLFLVKKDRYMDAARTLHQFLQGAEINKRSNLRNDSFDFKDIGVLRYKSINHNDFPSWKRAVVFETRSNHFYYY